MVFGARTTAGADVNTAQQQWKYVAVRRMALFIEQTLYANLTWAVFEGNSTPLWNALTQEVTAFMLSLFRQGAFAGRHAEPGVRGAVRLRRRRPRRTSATASSTSSSASPRSCPAEFVVVQIAQLAGQAQS